MYSTTLQNTLVLLLGLTNIVHGHEWIRNKIWGRAAAGDKLAKLLTPAIKPRASFIGGWALKEFPCPTEYEALDGGCCPKGSFGFSVNLQGLPKGFACCPDEEISCGQAISAMWMCADPSWHLWVNDGQHPFCCPQGGIGYETPGGIWGAGSLCAPSDVPVPTSILASSVEVSTAAPQTQGQKTSTGAATTPTSDTSDTPSTSDTSGGNTNTNINDNSVSVGSSTKSTGLGSNSVNGSTTSDNSSSGLPTAAIAGIVVGAVVVLVLLAIIFFLLKKRKNTPVASSYDVAEPKPVSPSAYCGNEQTAYNEAQVKPNPNYYPPAAEVDGAPAPLRPHQNYYPSASEGDGNLITDRGDYRGELSG